MTAGSGGLLRAALGETCRYALRARGLGIGRDQASEESGWVGGWLQVLEGRLAGACGASVGGVDLGG